MARPGEDWREQLETMTCPGKHCRADAKSARVAEMLVEDEDWLWDVANEMDQEDGLISVYGSGDGGRPGWSPLLPAGSDPIGIVANG